MNKQTGDVQLRGGEEERERREERRTYMASFGRVLQIIHGAAL